MVALTKHKLKIKQTIRVSTLLLVLLCSKSWGQVVYSHDFGSTTISGSPYTVAPTTIDANLNSSQWASSTGTFTSFGGSTGQALSLPNSSGTPSMTLTFNVAAGCQLDITSFNFWRQRSSTGAQTWTLTINGIVVGNGTVPTTGASIGNTAVATAVNGLTGAVSVVFSVSGASGTGTIRLDDFTLNGSTSCGNTITTGVVSGTPFSLPTCTATATGTVAFTSSGTFTGNTYTAQLSDASGSFASPTTIGTLVSNANSGNINITIPAGTGSGTGYLIRVISDGPSITGSNSAAFTVTLTCAGSGSCTINGAIGSGYNVGCGNGATPCDLASVYSAFGTFCGGSAVTCGSCPNTNVSSTYNLGAGCTVTLTAEFKARTIAGSDCSNSAMDASDQLSITNSGGVVSSQTSTMAVTVATCGAYPAFGTYTTAVSSLSVGCGNSGGTVQMIITGGAITVGATMNRGDEILTYTLSASGSCSACPVLLPVDFVDFYATQNGDKNDIFWKVINEENIKNYIIEKSEDGINFSELINQKSSSSTSGLVNYFGEDLNPLEGITYYRLMTHENNLVVKYHKTISLDRINQEWKSVFYQQNYNLYLEFKNSVPKNSTVSLFDLSGKLLANEIIKNSQTIINTQSFAEGIYFLRISNPYKTENYKLILQK